MQERIPDTDYQQLHHFISHSGWDGVAVMGEVAVRIMASFSMLSGSVGLLLDESGWEKSGKKSVGVARQYIGQVGKVANGQVGVFAALNKGAYVGLVNARLYLPREWTTNPARCLEAGIGLQEQQYRTKPQLAIEMVKDLVGKVVYDWVGGDAAYGNSPALRQYLVDSGRSFVLDVGQELGVYLTDPKPFLPEKKGTAGRVSTRFATEQTAKLLKNVLSSIPNEQWQTLTYRNGTKGKMQRQAVLMDAWVWTPERADKPEVVQLLISRELDGGEVKFSLCHQTDEPMTLETALYRQMQRYWVERAFQDVKEQLGMHQYQVRSWMAWHHHIALTMMALHFILHARIEQKEEVPMLSTADVKLLLALKLLNKLNEPESLWLAIQQRHRLRSRDQARHYP